MVDLSTKYISNVECGFKTPKLNTFVSIANALQCDADLLLLDVLDVTTEQESVADYAGLHPASTIVFDEHVETIQVDVTSNDGLLSAEVTYDADGPAFRNASMPGDLLLLKNVNGQTAANANDVFSFRVHLRTQDGSNLDNATIIYGPVPTRD